MGTEKIRLHCLNKEGNWEGTNVFMNDHLTKMNEDIARKAMYPRKQNKIQNTWVTNCKIFIKLNGTPEEAKVLVIRSMEGLDKYN